MGYSYSTPMGSMPMSIKMAMDAMPMQTCEVTMTHYIRITRSNAFLRAALSISLPRPYWWIARSDHGQIARLVVPRDLVFRPRLTAGTGRCDRTILFTSQHKPSTFTLTQILGDYDGWMWRHV